MHQLSLLQRIYMAYLGRMYAFTFHTTWRRFWGIRLEGWLRFGLIALLLASWIWDWPRWLFGGLILLFVWVGFSYWRAEKAGYHKFVADKTAVFPQTTFEPLKPDERITIRATGPFALSRHEESVLLRPAKYWRTPLGDHTVMVEYRPEQFLYQFFSKDTLETVQAGWLIFGRHPIRALAVSFCSKWGPDFLDYTQAYYVGGGEKDPPCQQRAVAFTFASDSEHAAVWHRILLDLDQE